MNLNLTNKDDKTDVLIFYLTFLKPIFHLNGMLRHSLATLEGSNISRESSDVGCCIFWPAFGCCPHPKSDQTTFFSRFQPFLCISLIQSLPYLKYGEQISLVNGLVHHLSYLPKLICNILYYKTRQTALHLPQMMWAIYEVNAPLLGCNIKGPRLLMHLKVKSWKYNEG